MFEHSLSTSFWKRTWNFGMESQYDGPWMVFLTFKYALKCLPRILGMIDDWWFMMMIHFMFFHWVVNWWFWGPVVWIPRIPLWKGLLLKGIPIRIPNHPAPNHQSTISWFSHHLERVPQPQEQGTKTITMVMNHLRPSWGDPPSEQWKKPGWLGCIGDDTTQLHRDDYNKPV